MKKHTVEFIYGVKSLHHLKDCTVEQYFKEKIALGDKLIKELSKEDLNSEVLYRIKVVARAIVYNKERLAELNEEFK